MLISPVPVVLIKATICPLRKENITDDSALIKNESSVAVGLLPKATCAWVPLTAILINPEPVMIADDWAEELPRVCVSGVKS